jgi:predicted PurR-regulated permease PerM
VTASGEPGWRETWPWLLGGLLLVGFIYLLAPILTPFVVGAALAYIGDPLVDRLERLKLSRTAGVSLVFVVLCALAVLFVVLLVPMLQNQFTALVRNVPEWLRWMQDVGLPRLGLELPAGLRLDAESLKQVVTSHWGEAKGLFTAVWARVSTSSLAVLTAAANLLMIPIVTFYLLRDWDRLVAWIRDVLPRRWLARTTQMARETDDVLSAFIRGQLLVMAAQAFYYAVALWIAGLELALIVGLIVGLISFVPYLGFIGGIAIATISMLVQTQDLLPLVWVGVVFTIGQLLESNVLTPLLVGDRIGLHPVAVIFAVMAGGQLFGFVGVLLALPLAAVIAVLLRHAKIEWLRSPVYLAGALSAETELPAVDTPPDDGRA